MSQADGLHEKTQPCWLSPLTMQAARDEDSNFTLQIEFLYIVLLWRHNNYWQGKLYDNPLLRGGQKNDLQVATEDVNVIHIYTFSYVVVRHMYVLFQLYTIFHIFSSLINHPNFGGYVVNLQSLELGTEWYIYVRLWFLLFFWRIVERAIISYMETK